MGAKVDLSARTRDKRIPSNRSGGSGDSDGFCSRKGAAGATNGDESSDGLSVDQVYHKAKDFQTKGQNQQAKELYQRALSKLKALNIKNWEAVVFCGLGDAQLELGEYEASISSFENALKSAQQQHDLESVETWVYRRMGFAYTALRQYKTAVEYHGRDLSTAKLLKDKRGEGHAYSNLGSTYHDWGEYEKAIRYHEKDLSIAGQLCDKSGQGRAYCNLGNTYHDLGEYEKAIQYHEKDLSVAGQLCDKSGQGRAYCNLGNAYYESKAYKEAVDAYAEYSSIALEAGDKSVQGAAYGNLGCAYRRLGDYEKALEFHKEEMAIAVKLDSRPAIQQACIHLGDVYGSIGNHEKAIELQTKYLSTAEQLGDKNAQARAHALLSLQHLHTGSNASALRHFSSFDSVLRNLERELTEAQWRRHLKAFGELYSASMDAWAIAAAQVGDMLEALRVEEWRRSRFELPYLAGADGGAAANVRSMGGEVTTRGLGNIARNVDASFVIIWKIYRDTLLTWVLSGETGELMYHNICEDAEKVSAVPDWIESVTFSEWARWQQSFSQAREKIRERSRKRILITSAWLRHLCDETLPIDMRGDIDKDLWESLRSPAKFRSAVHGCGEIFAKVQSYFLNKAERALEELSTLLWKPIVRDCEALRKLCESAPVRPKPIYFLPDSLLSPIPFSAFKVGDLFLIQRTPVAQASSLCTLDYACHRWHAISREKKKTAQKALIVSYTESDEGQLYEDESKGLSELLPGELLAGGDASENTVLEKITNGSASLIHFIAHGVDAGDAKREGLHLAENTVLNAQDFYEYYTRKKRGRNAPHTRLMVLCAGLSVLGHRESVGQEGFARAAMAGGIPCLLASKWSVLANEGITLMMHIYAYMATNKDQYRTVAQALQTAIVSLLQSNDFRFRDSFFYWAAFIPYGFASVRLDDELLGQMHSILKTRGLLEALDEGHNMV